LLNNHGVVSTLSEVASFITEHMQTILDGDHT